MLRKKLLIITFALAGALIYSPVLANNCPSASPQGLGCTAGTYYCNGGCLPGLSWCPIWSPSPKCASGLNCANCNTADLCGVCNSCNSGYRLCGTYPDSFCKDNNTLPSNCANYNANCDACASCSAGYTLEGGACVVATLKLGSSSVSGTNVIQGGANSALFVSGNKVGIGISAPTANLQINSTTGTEGLRIITSNYSPFIIRNITDTADLFRIDQDGNITSLGNMSGSNTYWNFSGSSLFASSTAWNVGIGTTNATDKLTVVGGINSNSAINGLSLCINGDCKVSWGDAGWAFDGNTVTQNKSFGTLDNYSIPFLTNSVERMRLTNTGNLVIGTSTTGVRLHVESPQGAVAFFKSKINGGSYAGYIGNGQTFSGEEFGLYYTDGLFDNRLAVYNLNNSVFLYGGHLSSDARLAISNNTGNVGVGTTNPGDKLHVFGGNIRLNNNYGINTLSSGGSVLNLLKVTAADNLTFGPSVAGSDTYIYGGDGSSNRYLVIKSTGSIGVGVATPQSKFDIEGNLSVGATYSGSNAAPANGMIVEGSVGIGTTTPGAYRLSVDGTTRLNGSVTTSLSGSGNRCVYVDATGNLLAKGVDCGTATGGDNLGDHSATQNIRLNSYWLSGDAGNEGIFVDSAGGVGVGTSNPGSYRLNVAGTSNLGGNLTTTGTVSFTGVVYAGGGNRMITVDNAGVLGAAAIPTNTDIYWTGTATNLVPATARTSLGLGSLATLSSVANAQITDVAWSKITGFPAACSAGQYVTAVGGTLTCATPAGGVSGSGAANYITKWTAGSALGSSIIYESGGNLGIGTTGPTNLLHLNLPSESYIRGIIITEGTEAIASLVNGAASAPNKGALSLYEGGVERVKLIATANAPSYINAGNFGIGTTNPGTYRLNVAGTSNLGGNLTTTGTVSFTGVVFAGGGNRMITVDNAGVLGASAMPTALPAGTTSYTLRYDGSNWVSNGNLFNNGTNVGIGTTTPGAYRLSVDGTTRLNGAVTTSLSGSGNRCVYVDSTGNLLAKGVDCGTATGGDNLGDHSATQNIRLNSYWLSGDAGNEGIFVDSAGGVGVGTNSITAGLRLLVSGNLSSSGTVSFTGPVYSGGGNRMITVDNAGVLGAAAIPVDTNTDIYWTGTATNLVPATARTSLGLGSLATLSSVSNAQITDVAWSKITGFPAACSAGQYVTAVGGTLTCATPAGGVSGSGTTNYISKWTAGSALGNSIIYDNGTNVGIGTSVPGSYRLNVSGSSNLGGNVTATGTVSFTGVVFAGGGNRMITVDNAGVLGAAAMPTALPAGTTSYTLRYDGSNWVSNGNLFNNGTNVGIGTTSPGAKLHVVGNAIISSSLTMGGDVNMGGNNITNLNKLTVNTIDPLYNIQGVNYSTFASSIVGGVKEEYVGTIKVTRAVSEGGEEYEAVVNFDTITKGSDLWVWRQVVDFSPENVQVNITPYGGFASAYYQIKGNKLIFRSDRPAELSYRLVGKRLDWRQWPTKALDQQEEAGFQID